MNDIIREFYVNDFQKQITKSMSLCNITMEEFAKRLDISRQTLDNWKNFRGKCPMVNALAVSFWFDAMTESDSDKRAKLLSWYNVSKNTMFQYAIEQSSPKSLIEAWKKKCILSDEKNKYSKIFINDYRFTDYKILLDIYSLSLEPIELFLKQLKKTEPLILFLWSKDIERLRKLDENKLNYATKILEYLSIEKDKVSLKKWDTDSGSESSNINDIMEVVKINTSAKKNMLFTSDYSKTVRALSEGIEVGFLDSDGSLIDVKSFPEGIKFIKEAASYEALASPNVLDIIGKIEDNNMDDI